MAILYINYKSAQKEEGGGGVRAVDIARNSLEDPPE